jgi:hypothetical protein
VINNILRYFVLIGMPLLIIAVSFLPMFEATMMNGVLAQTTDGIEDAVVLDSGTNETAATTTGNNDTNGPKFLFIQSAQSGSISNVNATTYTLELNDVSDKTIMFSDRPDRIVAATNTTNFIGNWSTGPDSLAADPPNAVLVLDDEHQGQGSAVIELYNPRYDSEAKTLKYDMTAVNATATTPSSIDLPSEFGQSTLMIDTQAAPISNLSNIARLITSGSYEAGFELKP